MKKTKSSPKKTLFLANRGRFSKGTFFSDLRFQKIKSDLDFSKCDFFKKLLLKNVPLNAGNALFWAIFFVFFNCQNFFEKFLFFYFYFQKNTTLRQKVFGNYFMLKKNSPFLALNAYLNYKKYQIWN